MSWTPWEGRPGELWDEAVWEDWGGGGGCTRERGRVGWGGGTGWEGSPWKGEAVKGRECGLWDLVGLLGSAVLSGGLLRTLGNLQ